MNEILEEKDIDIRPLVHEEYEEADFEELMKISDRLIKQHMEAYTALANAESLEEGREYIKLNYEDIKNISDELIEKNKEAYINLANF